MHLKVYYAHPMSLYGTAQEQRDIVLLTQLGYLVVNPNSPESELGYRALGMEFFREMVQKGTDVLAFRAFPDGSIPAGIAKEIAMALEAGHAVFEIPTNVIRRTLSVEATREFLQECGNR